jgi:uncharacterized membrane protein
MNHDIDFKHHAERAWQLTLKHIFSLILLTLATVTVGLLSMGLLAPAAMAGYVDAIYRLLRTGREPDLRDVFSQMRLALPLLGLSLAVLVITAIGYSLLVLPGIIISLAVSHILLYVVPLMIDRRLGVVDAVKASYRMATANPLLDNILVTVVVMGLLGIGGSVVIGWLFTYPLATVFLVSVYCDKMNAPGDI